MGKRLTALYLTGLLVVGLAFQVPSGAKQRPQQQPSPTLPGDIDSVSDSVFGAYIRKLTFVPDTEAGDRRALLLGRYPDSARFGPVATILPEINSNQGSLAQLARQGKVIAKMQVESIGAQPYPKLGLQPGATTYWWVQFNPSDTGVTGRSVFVTVNGAGHILTRITSDLHVKREHRYYRIVQPIARFIWNPVDDGLWGTCNGACCSKN
jgi:hypothetical protein